MMTKMCRKIYHIIALEADEFDADLTFDEVDGDYIVHCIYDLENDIIVFLNDNTHDDPQRFFDGFKAGIKICEQEIIVENILLFMNDDESPYYSAHIRAALDRYLEGVE